MRCAPAAHTRRNHLAKASSDGGRRSGTYVKTQRPVDKLTRKGVSRPFGEVTARLRPAPDPLVRRSGNSHSPGHPGPRSMKLGKCSSDYNHSEKTTLNSGGPSSRTRELFLGGWDGASGTPGLQTRGGAVSSGGLLGAGCLPRKRTGGLFFLHTHVGNFTAWFSRKMPKFKAARAAGGQEKHAPLAEQILAGDAVRAGAREKRRGRGTGDEEEEYVGPRLTRRILQQARQQQEELEAEHGSGDRPAVPRERTTRLGEWGGWGTRRRVGSWGERLKGVWQGNNLEFKKKKKKLRPLARVMGLGDSALGQIEGCRSPPRPFLRVALL